MTSAAWHDLRFAVRTLWRTPAFTAATILTLALGIGATTTIFTVLNGVLLKPLPYADPDRLLVLAPPDEGAQSGQLFRFMRDRSRAMQHVAAQDQPGGWNVVAGDVATYAPALHVSAGYFEAHGARPVLGRTFTAADDTPGGANVVIIPERLWERALGRRSDAIGQTILLGGMPHEIVGVMPDGFRSIPETDVWTPLRVLATDNTVNYRIFGRLAAGATPGQAAAELDTLRSSIAREFPRTNPERLAGTQWRPLQTYLGAASRAPLLMLLGAAGFLLLIASVNVASLQLSRALGLRRELATRAALGASRRQLARQVLVESALLAAAGAAAGVALALAAARVLVGLLSEPVAARLLPNQPFGVDWRVLLFAAGVGALSTMIFGVTPAMVASRVDLRRIIGGAPADGGRRPLWARRVLAAGEIALAVMLLVGAGLLVRTLVNLRSIDPGFSPNGVVVARTSLQGAVDNAAELEQLLTRGLAALRGIRGVTGASASSGIPVEQSTNLPLEPPPNGLIPDIRGVEWRYVTSGYFDVFGIQRRAGRLFDEHDTAAAAPVAIVNETFARAYFGRADVIGEHVQLVRAFQDPPRRIVGVVADVRARSAIGWVDGLTALGTGFAPAIFVPSSQVGGTALRSTHQFYPIAWAITADRPAAEVARDVTEAMRAVAPAIPFARIEPMEAVIARDLEIPRLFGNLLGVFAGLALVLAALGVYGLMSHAAAQRTREVGVRMALGATAGAILRRFAGEGLAIATTGLAIGMAGATLVTDLLAALLFGVTPLDASTFVAAAALLLIVAAVATLLPAARAARVDPVLALRSE